MEQEYLPDALVGRCYYVPGDQGYEVTLAQRLAEAQKRDARS